MAIIEPGGRVTQNEDGMFTSAGGLSARFTNWLNEAAGEGLSSKSIEEIRDALNRQYVPSWEAANRARVTLEQQMERMRASGRNVQSPIGNLGIEWGANVTDRNQLDAQTVAPQMPAATAPKIPPGFYGSDPTKDPKVQAIPPGGRRRAQRG